MIFCNKWVVINGFCNKRVSTNQFMYTLKRFSSTLINWFFYDERDQNPRNNDQDAIRQNGIGM